VKPGPGLRVIVKNVAFNAVAMTTKLRWQPRCCDELIHMNAKFLKSWGGSLALPCSCNVSIQFPVRAISIGECNSECSVNATVALNKRPGVACHGGWSFVSQNWKHRLYYLPTYFTFSCQTPRCSWYSSPSLYLLNHQ